MTNGTYQFHDKSKNRVKSNSRTLKLAATYHHALHIQADGVCRKVALTPVDMSVDNGGEAGAVPVDALGDTAAGAVASFFQGVT